MKTTALKFGLAVLLLLNVSSVLAVERGYSFLISDQNAAEAILGPLQDAVWAIDGAAADKPVYVVYNAACGWSRKLFEDARGHATDVQLRWIPDTEVAEHYILSERNSEAIQRGFQNRPGPVRDTAFAQRASAWNDWITKSFWDALRPYAGGRNLMYPTLVYRTENGVRVISGNPRDFRQVANDILPQPAHHEPLGLSLAESDFSITPAPRLKNFLNRADQPVPVYMFPDKRAPIIMELRPQYSFSVSGVIEEDGWVAVQPWVQGNRNAYIHAPLHARLATLNFRVRRASGNVTARDRDLEIRTHPHPDAPVVHTLPQGYQVRKSGEVELQGVTWYEVRALSDGSPGYVVR